MLARSDEFATQYDKLSSRIGKRYLAVFHVSQAVVRTQVGRSLKEFAAGTTWKVNIGQGSAYNYKRTVG